MYMNIVSIAQVLPLVVPLFSIHVNSIENIKINYIYFN